MVNRYERLLWAIIDRYHPNGVELSALMMELLQDGPARPDLGFRWTKNDQRGTYILSVVK